MQEELRYESPEYNPNFREVDTYASLPVNKTQTEFTRKLADNLPKELYDEFTDLTSKVQLIQNMISPERRYAKDMPKDKFGKIIVDLENPHVLEDMDYFRPAAIHFEKYGRYTFHYPSKSKNSPYYKFWKEEVRRCRQGYVRESDGEWISGYYYYYLNYSRIEKTVVLDESQRDELDGQEGGLRSERVEGFPTVWDGDYLFFHYVEKAERKGKYGNLLKTRGRGFSFKGGSMLSRNMLIFKKSNSYAMASETEYLTKDGILGKAYRNMDWAAEHTPWPRLRLVDQGMHKKLGYKHTETGASMGFLSQIIGVTTKDNPDRARGKRGKLILFEESGKYPKLDKVWSIGRPSMEQGSHVFGFMLAGGTGGVEGADFATALKFFYSPRGYNILSMNNVYDKTQGKGTCSFFFPEYLNREECYDENGNSDIIKAIIQVLNMRYEVKYGTDDPHALTQEKADRPFTPQEAIMRTGGTLFPVQKIKDYLSQIEPNLQEFVSPHYVGRLYRNSSFGVSWKADPNIMPIRTYPLSKEDSKKGGVEIFEQPKIPSGKIRPEPLRYIAGIDPVDDDYVVQSSSLVSIFIMDTYTDRIVAEYTARPDLAEEFYDTCIDLLEYYNAIANYENDKKGLYTHFYNKKKLHLLCDTPKILKDMNMVRGVSRGNKSKGTPSSVRINQFGRRLQRDWMLKVAVGEDEDSGILNLFKIRSIAYLKELEQWNPDGNFDRISAMGMLMILREDIELALQYRNSEDYIDDNLSEDPFLEANSSPIEGQAVGSKFNTALYETLMNRERGQQHEVAMSDIIHKQQRKIRSREEYEVNQDETGSDVLDNSDQLL